MHAPAKRGKRGPGRGSVLARFSESRLGRDEDKACIIICKEKHKFEHLDSDSILCALIPTCNLELHSAGWHACKNLDICMHSEEIFTDAVTPHERRLGFLFEHI
jgi:hypothetical protein